MLCYGVRYVLVYVPPGAKGNRFKTVLRTEYYTYCRTMSNALPVPAFTQYSIC